MLGASTHQKVGLDAQRLKFLNGVLGRLGLQLVSCRDVRDERAVHECDVFRSALAAPLADRLDERLRLDVADRAAHFRDDDIGRRLVGDALDALFDGVRDMRDDLHRAAQEVAMAFAGDERLVDGALRDV